MRSCNAVILAAGESRRMGQPKQLLKVGDETLLERTVRIALAARFEEVAVVLGANAETMRPVAERPGVRIVVNSEWKEGMASSVRCGVSEFIDSEGIMILLVDQPTVTTQWLNQLLDRFAVGDADVVTTAKGGVTSPPAAFSRSMYPALLGLSGEHGAKSLLPGAKVIEMEFEDSLPDVDTPEDLRFLDAGTR